MKSQTKMKLLITVIVAIILLTMSTLVNAETGGNYSVGMSLTSNSKLKEGEIVTVTLNLTSVNAGNGIDTIEADFAYDTNVFESLAESDFQTSNNWRVSYRPDTNRVTLQKNTRVTSNETIVTIQLKAKSTVSVDSSSIKLSNIIASGGRVADGGTGDITVNNAVVTLSKEKNASSTTETPIQTPTTNKTTTNNTVKDSTTTNKTKLPKTGIAQYGTIAILIVAIVGIFTYALYKKISKDVK